MNLKDLSGNFFVDDSKYIFWGAGKTCKEFYIFCKEYLEISFIIDTNTNIKDKGFLDLKIYNPDEIFLKDLKYKIIITSVIYFTEIKKILEDNGLKYNENFFYYKDIISLLKWKNKSELWITQVDIPITTKCNAKCRDCSVLIPYYKKHEDRSFDEIKKDIDLFFDFIDGIYDFIIIGGEAFINKEFIQILSYIGDNYRNKIINLICITNGKIIPNYAFINLFKKYDVEIQISDYSELFINEEIKNKLKKVLSENSIKYKILPMDRWVDYGNPYIKKNLGETYLKKLFNNCNTQCRTLYDKKIYFCFRNCAAVRLGAIKSNENDYIDLENKNLTKEEILNFEIGNLSLGYSTFCDYCNGQPSVNKKLIPAGIQVK